MKQTKAIYLLFSDGNGSSSASIIVPFPVKYINIKGISYNTDSSPTVGSEYSVLETSLTNYSPLGVVYRDSSKFSSSFGASYEYPQPTIISGTYTFQLKNLQGGNQVENSNDDTCVVIAEFTGIDS